MTLKIETSRVKDKDFNWTAVSEVLLKNFDKYDCIVVEEESYYRKKD